PARGRQARARRQGPGRAPGAGQAGPPRRGRPGVALSRPSLTAMSRARRMAIVLGLLAAGVIAAVMAAPIPQDPAYHRLADGRAFFGIPNALNVISNAPFVLVCALGGWGGRPGGGGTAGFIDGRERWPWMVLFAGLLLTGFGSAYYHLEPNNQRLVWDRLPLAAALMGLF